jgi:putative ABC transport system permease protein
VVLSGDGQLAPPTGPTVPFELVDDPSMVQPPLLAGQAPQSGLDIEIGRQVENEMGARPGSVLQLGPGWWAGSPEQALPTRVAGVVQDIENDGNIVLGSTYLGADLAGDVSSEGVLVRCATASTCPAVGRELAALSGGAWAITSAHQGTVLPFASSVEDVSVALCLAFALLAGAGSLFSGLVTSRETALAYGLLRALGAQPRQLVATVAVQVGVIAVPALVVGLLAGYPLAHWALGRATASLGGLQVGTPFRLPALALVVVAGASGLGLGLPLARVAASQPARSMSAGA